MKVIIENINTQTSRTFAGTKERVTQDLLQAYAYCFDHLTAMFGPNHWDFDSVIERLHSQQPLFVQVVADPKPNLGLPVLQKSNDDITLKPDVNLGVSAEIARLLGNSKYKKYIDAARFIAGGEIMTLKAYRRALWLGDADPVRMALCLYDIADNEENRAALMAVLDLAPVQKHEMLPQSVPGAVVKAPFGVPPEEAQEIQAALDEGRVEAVQLRGQHSHGAFVAKVPHTQTAYLLKPGDVHLSPAAGVKDEKASESQREAAFYAIAKAWGLGADYPKTSIVEIDGKNYAKIELLGWDFKDMDDRRSEDGSFPQRCLEPYRASGQIYKWAVLDFVLGNPDSHAGNIMASNKGVVKLIDHGSAFAGNHFAPGHDQYSFTPFYLRYTAPAPFHDLDHDEQMKYLPQVSDLVQNHIWDWIQGLREAPLVAHAAAFGIEPEPECERLRVIKMLPPQNIAEAIFKLWL